MPLSDGVSHYNSLLATTDENGKFSVNGLPEAIELITIYHPDYAPVAVRNPQGGNLDIVLSEGGTLEGTITVGGKGLSDHSVGVLRMNVSVHIIGQENYPGNFQFTLGECDHITRDIYLGQAILKGCVYSLMPEESGRAIIVRPKEIEEFENADSILEYVKSNFTGKQPKISSNFPYLHLQDGSFQ